MRLASISFTMNHLEAHIQFLAAEVRAGDPRALARAISIVENRSDGWIGFLKAIFTSTGKAKILGLTGSPGAGKSTLVDQLSLHYRKDNHQVGIIAVDQIGRAHV